MGTVQPDWRECVKCTVLYFDGYPADKGACPADGHGHEHAADGFMFALTHDVPESNHAQGHWRFCHKCTAMFYDGYPTKGTCDRDLAGHEAAGFIFVLPYNYPDSATQQSGWGFCNKCNVMFHNGDQNTGHCAAGGVHVGQGFVFALPHLALVSQTIDQNP